VPCRVEAIIPKGSGFVLGVLLTTSEQHVAELSPGTDAKTRQLLSYDYARRILVWVGDPVSGPGPNMNMFVRRNGSRKLGLANRMGAAMVVRAMVKRLAGERVQSCGNSRVAWCVTKRSEDFMGLMHDFWRWMCK